MLANAPKHSFSSSCTYCGHCAPCPKKIDIAMVNKLYDLALMQKEVSDTVKAHYKSLKANAADCIECGSCEKRCPFSVNIIEKMRGARKIFC